MLDTSALPDKAAFASANGWTYAGSAPAPGYSGSTFEYLLDATVADVFRSGTGPATEVGIVSGKIGGGQAWQGTGGAVSMSFETNEIATLGYMAIRLQASLPQYVLDSRRNDGGPLSSIIMPIAGGQTISLEGDFDSHFILYGPKGYETDARYVFTPDLMGLLIDETGDFDVEITDDTLFVYARNGWDLTSAALWERLDRIRSVVGAKTLRQTGRYRDANPAGQQARRLRLGIFGTRNKASLILGFALVLGFLVAAIGVIVAVVVFVI